MHHYRTALINWLPLAVAITALCLLVEVTVQQSYRTSLNDPQQQIAEDTARVVAAGVDPSLLAPKGTATEISASLGTWMAVYDTQLSPKASTGLLHGIIPTIPQGVFETARARGSYAVTWQPEPGVRQALVIVPAGEKGFAVSGRNMRAVEDRESQLGWLVLVGWAGSLLATFLAFIVAEPLVRRVVQPV